MNKKFTPDTAVNFQGMEQRTANLKSSLSFNLFNKLKWISFVIILVMGLGLQSQNIAIFPGPVPDLDFEKFPPFTLLPSSQPTYRLGFGLPPTPDAIPLLVEGNIGTNHSFPGTFGTVGGTARWNAIGDRVPLGFLPYISTTGFRSTWENFGLNVGMSQTYSGAGRDALISWQDATILNPLLASNRLVFGVRDSSTTNFEEVAQIATNNGTLFGIGIVDSNNPFVPEEQLHLYNFRTPPDTSPLPLYQKWSNDFNPVGSRIGYPGGTNVNFQIRNDDTSSIEFWTNNNPQVYINEQPGATPFLGVGTAGPASPTVNLQGPGGAGGWITGVLPNPPIPVANPYLSVLNGDITTTGNFYGANIFITSDERLKKNIAKLPEWKKIFDIESYTYQYIDQKHNLSSYGFLAQDVYKIIPELTSGWGDALSVNYIGFIPFLSQGLKDHEDRLVAIEEVKETEKHILEQVKLLDSENNELKNQNKLLKERLEALERKFEYICQLPCLQEGSVKSDNTRIKGGTLELMDNAILYQNEPNPFTSSTVIRYYLPEGTKNSTITVKNTEGKIVGEYQNLISGNGSISIEPGKLAANTYYYNLIIDGIEVETKKMILMR